MQLKLLLVGLVLGSTLLSAQTPESPEDSLRHEIDHLKAQLRVERLRRIQADKQAQMFLSELQAIQAQQEFKTGFAQLRDACVAKADDKTDRFIDAESLECIARPKPKPVDATQPKE